MKTELDNSTLTVVLDERIDSVNALQTEAELNDALQAAPAAALVLDAGALTYISSAGLRVLLRLQRQHPALGCHILQGHIVNRFVGGYDVGNL